MARLEAEKAALAQQAVRSEATQAATLKAVNQRLAEVILKSCSASSLVLMPPACQELCHKNNVFSVPSSSAWPWWLPAQPQTAFACPEMSGQGRAGEPHGGLGAPGLKRAGVRAGMLRQPVMLPVCQSVATHALRE